MSTAPDVTIQELTTDEGLALVAKAAQQFIPGDHESEIEFQMLLPFVDNYPWVREDLELRQLKDIEPGMYLCPAQWDIAYTEAGYEIDPWAIAIRKPITLRILQACETTWRYETRITCLTPDAMTMYYVGKPEEYVRVVVPTMDEDDQPGE